MMMMISTLCKTTIHHRWALSLLLLLPLLLVIVSADQDTCHNCLNEMKQTVLVSAQGDPSLLGDFVDHIPIEFHTVYMEHLTKTCGGKEEFEVKYTDVVPGSVNIDDPSDATTGGSDNGSRVVSFLMEVTIDCPTENCNNFQLFQQPQTKKSKNKLPRIKNKKPCVPFEHKVLMELEYVTINGVPGVEAIYSLDPVLLQ